MAEKLLSARAVQTITKPGYHSDGGGLYLRVTATGTKSWIFRYQLAGKRRDMGLGRVSDVTLAEARGKAAEARQVIASGGDPLQPINESQPIVPTSPSFRDVAAELIRAKEPSWRNAKHGAQWESTLETYANPHIGDMAVDEIEASHVILAIAPIWHDKTETASRVRGRIEAVLDYAAVMGWRSGDNPARWKGNLSHLLPKRQGAGHFVSMEYADLPAFWPRLLVADGLGARALQLAILTACRSGEVRGATWGEIDLEAAVWSIPAARMKAKADHRVPLTSPALALLRSMRTIKRDESDFVFQGRGKAPISDMTVTAVLRRMGLDVVPHGFRATFRTWAAECTDYREDLVEAALAHTKGKLTAAYQRGDMLEKRRALMEDWATFVTLPS
jgi:integrase